MLQRVCNDGDVRVADFTMVGDLIVRVMTSFDVIMGDGLIGQVLGKQ